VIRLGLHFRPKVIHAFRFHRKPFLPHLSLSHHGKPPFIDIYHAS